MEPVVEPPAEAELHLLTDWSDPDAPSRHRKAAAGAIAVNLALIGLFMIPQSPFRANPLPEPEQRVMPLVLPELTQRDPNHGKVTREFEVQAPRAPQRAIQAPPTPPPVKAAEVPKPAPPPRPVVPTALPEPPKVEAARETPAAELPRTGQQTAPPPPQIQVAEKPKLMFENPAPPPAPVPPDKRRVALPTNSVQDIAREVVGGGSPMGIIIGDAGASESGYNGMSQSPTPGNPLANVQLQSDTEGVDFKPYLIQLIATVRRNWMAVIPESARMGRRGKVALQFVVLKNGVIDKVVYAEQSGTPALDRAAVAGISASNPLPPLPQDFRGTRIVLQLNFLYR